MAKMTRRMAEAKIQETLNEYNKKIEEAKNYIDYLPLEGKKLVENYEKNLDNRKTLLNKALEDKSFFETLTDEQVFNLLRICQALIKKFELVIKEDNNMIEKKNNLDKAMLLLEEFGDEKSQKAIREYKNGKRSILFGKLSKNTYGMTKNLNSIYTHIITNDFEKDTIENQIQVAITLAHEFKRNGVTNSINVETRDIVLEDTKIIESFANIYGEEIYKKFPEYGILHYIKKIFGETEVKDFADFAFDSTGNYWKVNEAGDLIDDGNTSKVFDATGKEVYSGSTGRQGTLEAWLNLDNAFVSLLKPAGYEYNGKQWSKNPGKIDRGIIEKAHKGGLLTDDQYKLIQLAAGKSASNDDKSEKIGFFKQILTDYYKVKAMQTQVQIDLADRAWEWLGRKWNKWFGEKVEQTVLTVNVENNKEEVTEEKNKSIKTSGNNLYYKQPVDFITIFSPQTMNEFIQDENGSKCNLFLEKVTSTLSEEIAKKILPNGIKSAAGLHKEFQTNKNLKMLNPESHWHYDRTPKQLLESAKEAAQKATDMANAGYLVIAASPKYENYSAHVSFVISQDNKYNFDYNPNLEYQKIYQGTTGYDKHQQSSNTVLWDYPVFLQAGNSTGIVPPGSAFSRLLFNNDKVDYYVVKK